MSKVCTPRNELRASVTTLSHHTLLNSDDFSLDCELGMKVKFSLFVCRARCEHFLKRDEGGFRGLYVSLERTLLNGTDNNSGHERRSTYRMNRLLGK